MTQFASVLRVPLDSVEVELRATYPKDGDYGLGDSERTAMERLTYTMDIKSPASQDQILELMRRSEQGCYALNSLRVPVEVAPTLRLNGEEVPFSPPPPPELRKG